MRSAKLIKKTRDVVCKIRFCFLAHTRWSNVIKGLGFLLTMQPCALLSGTNSYLKKSGSKSFTSRSSQTKSMKIRKKLNFNV